MSWDYVNSNNVELFLNKQYENYSMYMLQFGRHQGHILGVVSSDSMKHASECGKKEGGEEKWREGRRRGTTEKMISNCTAL